jgi:hypothetical protein
VVGGALQRDVQATSRPSRLGLGDEGVEVLERAEVGVDRVVAAVGEPIAYGEPGSCRAGVERVVLALAAACRSGGSG